MPRPPVVLDWIAGTDERLRRDNHPDYVLLAIHDIMRAEPAPVRSGWKEASHIAQTRIFVSHSHQDNDWCRAFAAALTAIGYDVWYDETGLQGGDAWVKKFQHEVESRDIFLIVLTPEAWESQWVQGRITADELLQAYSLLRSAGQGYAEGGIMAALHRFIRLDTAEDILAPVSGGVTRVDILKYLRQTQRLDLAIRLLETWYGYPPSWATLDDLPLLDVYARALVNVGRADDARPIHEHVVHIVEEAYGAPGGPWWRGYLSPFV